MPRVIHKEAKRSASQRPSSTNRTRWLSHKPKWSWSNPYPLRSDAMPMKISRKRSASLYSEDMPQRNALWQS